MAAKNRLAPAARERNDWYASFLVWLGQEAHRKKLQRTCTPVLSSTTANHLRAFTDLCFPWSVQTYPGRTAMLAHVLGVKPATADRLQLPSALRLRQRHQQRMIAYLQGRITAYTALIARLESARPK